MCVCEREREGGEWEVTGCRSTATQKVFSAELRLDTTSGSPPALPAKAPALGYRERFYKSVVQKLDCEEGLRHGHHLSQ